MIVAFQCRGHVKEAKRHKSDPEYIPTWRRKQEKYVASDVSHRCKYMGCTKQNKVISTNDLLILRCLTVQDTDSTSLCEAHYQDLYRQAHAPTPCCGCGCKPKSRNGPYTRHSPDPTTISKYLSEKTGCSVDITQTDVLCKSCYNIHLAILNDINNPIITPSANQLDLEIARWTMTMRTHNCEVTKSILATVVYVGKKLLQDRALLLPQVVSFFLKHRNQNEHNKNEELEYEDSTVTFSARWLLHQLI
jgi:hypothetical protein